ncbi:MAG: cobaltochelatase subunit CobN, partial [Methanimicrococcus sp.]|nr:cobaltochelatase subunit CobN [Methanimicrococcus sp.]
NENEANDAVEKLSKQLRRIKNSNIPYGDHILGVAPEGEELAAMISAMISYQTSIDTHLDAVFSTDEMRENAKIKMITSIITGKSSNAAVDEVLDELLGTNAASVTSAQRNNIENALSNVNTYKNNIEACRNEITGLMDALDGQYITPGPTGDPIKKPDALPTGRNPYPMDPREIPTQAAYNMGVRLGNDLLKMYAEENQNASPEKVAFLLWAVEASRTGGINEGEIFYLLGVEPTWNTANNRINTQVFNVVSQNDLGRPRVDVVVEVSGSYRDTYAQQIAYINLAAKLASEQDEPDNPVRKNSLAILEILKADENLRAKYTDDELWDIACTRVFGPAPGEYTPGIENMAGTEYGSEANAAELYLARMSYMYVTFTSYEEGKTFKTEIWNFGEERSEDILKAHLKDVNMGVFSRSSEVYGLLDHPMVASYFGGLAAAINASGGNSDMYINNLRSGSNEVQTLSEFLITDLNSKYFNPKWIEGMMNSGYAGTSHMNEFFEVMSVWSMAMPDLITESMFKNMYETYINDDKNLDVSDYLKSTNPYAYQSMVGNLLNAIYNGDWQPSDEIRQQLEKDYVEQTALNGVVCCHHTCSNMKFNQNIVNGLTAIDLSDNIKQQYLQEVNMALNQNFSMRSNTSSSGSSRTSTPLNITNASENNTLNFSENSSVDGSGYGQDSDPAGTPEVSGYEMTVVDITTSSLRDFLSHPTVSVSNALLIIFVVFITGAIFYGFKKRSL